MLSLVSSQNITTASTSTSLASGAAPSGTVQVPSSTSNASTLTTTLAFSVEGK